MLQWLQIGIGEGFPKIAGQSVEFVAMTRALINRQIEGI